MILYRPVGLQELALIYDRGMKAFPARLPQQPIFIQFRIKNPPHKVGLSYSDR